MQLAHKIELKPNNKQKSYFEKAYYISRFVWNWALEEWEKEYKQGKKPNAFMLKKKFNAVKREKYPFVLEVTKYASQQPFIQLQKAFNGFFKGINRYPQFKSRKHSVSSFYIGGDKIKVKEKKVWIPKLGYVNMREEVRFKGEILSATISKRADKWYISFVIEVDKSPYQSCESQAMIGVDLGIEKFATLSDGTYFENIKVMEKYEKRLKKLQRALSRKQHPTKKGDKTPVSHNFIKQKKRVAKLHKKIDDARTDYIHKVTTYITEHYKSIVIEDLNVKGMMRNHHIAKAIGSIGMYEFRRQLEYKSKLRSNNLIVADRWYPSSKACSNCGYINPNLKLSDRVYRCPQCGLEIDRDLNAAINLMNYGRVSSTRTHTPVERGNVDDRSLLPKKHPLVEAGTQQINLHLVRFA